MAKHGKRYLEARAKVDREKLYSPHEAVRLLKETKGTKYDESVEVHVRTGLNVRHADEQLRGTIALPHGLGKSVTIAVFAKGAKAEHKDCALKCIENGGKLVFYNTADEKLYSLDNQDAAKEHLGHAVKVTGEAEGTAIKVEKIEMAEAGHAGH